MQQKSNRDIWSNPLLQLATGLLVIILAWWLFESALPPQYWVFLGLLGFALSVGAMMRIFPGGGSKGRGSRSRSRRRR